jgi:T3SS negative regulator,GrlR
MTNRLELTNYKRFQCVARVNYNLSIKYISAKLIRTIKEHLMIEAMYGVEFTSNTNDGGLGYGVVILETGRIFGGDSSFVYVGSYTLEHGLIKAKVRCTNDRGTMASVFESESGDFKEFNLQLEGQSEPKEFILQGYIIEHPEKTITAKLTLRAELP